MILDMAVGDALGACFEFADKKTIDDYLQNHKYLIYVQHPRHKDIKPGNYTDDTQMASVVAEVMLSGKFTKQRLADEWVKRFKHDERKGYSRGFYAFLQTCNNGSDLLSKIENRSSKSGAAMRAPPIGLYKNKNEVKQKAGMQAEITHAGSGVEAAIASALMVHYFYHKKGQKNSLRDFIAKEVNPLYNKSWHGKPSSQGWECVSAAIQAVEDNNNIPGLLVQCIRYGGDTDTVAAIAMAAASVCPEYRAQHDTRGKGWNKRLPVNLYNGLEPDNTRKFRREYLKNLDQRLYSKFKQ
jgi:ADP-ribosyl-[dinitrogen reductase] hydrolase